MKLSLKPRMYKLLKHPCSNEIDLTKKRMSDYYRKENPALFEDFTVTLYFFKYGQHIRDLRNVSQVLGHFFQSNTGDGKTEV